MRPTEWLDPEDAKAAKDMEECVRNQWIVGPDATPFTPHDPGHFERVEAWVRRLIPRDKWDTLSAAERKILTWCAWTHDIGMLRSVYSGDVGDREIREGHVKRSSDWVGDNYAALRLTPLEAQVVAEINRYHSRKYDLKECPGFRQFHGEFVKSRLLAAYVRLADALEVDFGRVSGEHYHRFDLLVHQLAPDSDKTLFHWVKSFVVSGIHLDHARQQIHVEFMRVKGLASEQFEYIKRYVLNEIDDELASVEKVLARGGVSSFLQVVSSEVELVDGAVKAHLEQSLERVLSYVQMARSPNSTAVTRAALGALRALLDRLPGDGDKITEDLDISWRPFLNRLQLLGQSLADQLAERSCHIELRRIYEHIKSFLDEHGLATHYDADSVEKLRKYAERFKKIIGKDEEREMSIAKEFRRALTTVVQDGGNKRSWSFLLFGCSETVAASLAHTVKELGDVELWIAEGRPKARHGARNTPIYCDAEAYLATLKDRGFKSKKVSIIPDAAVASLIARGDSHKEKPVDAVLFGTNGIYLSGKGAVAHTTGHLSIAMIASCFGGNKVPVIVLGTSAKIYPEPKSGWEEAKRHVDWLTSDSEFKNRLKKDYNADLDWNPREDHVPFDYLAAIVTEQGSVFPGRPDEKPLEMLGTWMKETLLYLDGSSTPKAEAKAEAAWSG